jgi:hypothetical protein
MDSYHIIIINAGDEVFINMKIILSESQINKIILLTEVETVGFKIKKWDPDGETTYTFIANKLEYDVDIGWYDNNKYGNRFYDVSFDFDKPKDSIYNSNLDIKHLNTVLYTVVKIIEDFVSKNPDISLLIIQAAYDESRGETENDDNNIRTRIYTRFIKQSNINYTRYVVDYNRIYIVFK